MTTDPLYPPVLSPVDQAEEQIRALLDQTARDTATIIVQQINPHDLTRGLRLLGRLGEILNDARAVVADGPFLAKGTVAPGVAGFLPDLMAMLREQVDSVKAMNEKRAEKIGELPPISLPQREPSLYELQDAVRAAQSLGDEALVEKAREALRAATLKLLGTVGEPDPAFEYDVSAPVLPPLVEAPRDLDWHLAEGETTP